MKIISILVLVISLSACATISEKSFDLKPGMSKEQVKSILGMPEDRSFRDLDEAWQYQEISGFGQCSYTTAWFRENKLLSMTTRRGGSIAGCGLGSKEVNWGQMPKPSIDVNVNISNDGS